MEKENNPLAKVSFSNGVSNQRIKHLSKWKINKEILQFYQAPFLSQLFLFRTIL